MLQTLCKEIIKTHYPKEIFTLVSRNL